MRELTKNDTADAAGQRAAIVNALNKAIEKLCSHAEETFGEVITDALRTIADAMNVNSIVFYRHVEVDGEDRLKQTYRWDKAINGLTEKSLDFLPNNQAIAGWLKTLRQNVSVNQQLCDWSSDELEFMNQFGIKSVFMAPIFTHGKFWGCVIFQDHINERFFSEDYAELMRSAAFLFVNAIIRAEMERETITALFEAQEANCAKSEFLSRMSHEILTPMNVIMGMTHILKMSGGSDETKKYLEEIDAASRYLLRLINDLLDISGKNNSAFTIASSVFDFNKIFREILKDVSCDVMKKRQTLNFGIDPSIPMLLFGDKKRLAQVITNLLTNASKFTPENGKIHFSAYVLSKDNETITLQIEITDNGIGIPKEKQNEIFSAFDLVDVSLTSKYSGAGLGLPISKLIVEMMGGKIWVDSEHGKGSKFTFTCKLHKRPPAVTGNS